MEDHEQKNKRNIFQQQQQQQQQKQLYLSLSFL